MKYRFHNMKPSAILQRLARETVIQENAAPKPATVSARAIEVDTVARWAGFTAEQFNEAYKIEKTKFMLCAFDIPTYRMECQQD